MPKYKIGIDVGGTFTDLIAISNNGETLTTKVLSVKDDQSAGIIKGLKKLGLRPEEVELIGHGFGPIIQFARGRLTVFVF